MFSALFILLIVSFVILILLNMPSAWICMGFIFAYKQALRNILIYGGLIGALFICSVFPENGLSPFVSMVTITYHKFAPPLFFRKWTGHNYKGRRASICCAKATNSEVDYHYLCHHTTVLPHVKRRIANALRLRSIGLLTRPLTVVKSALSHD